MFESLAQFLPIYANRPPRHHSVYLTLGVTRIHWLAMSKPYQIFVGCPFARDMRSIYDRLKRDIESTTPLSIVLADTVGLTSSDYLLESITTLITESTACIFDVTGANPNVSLEVGIAHTVPVNFLLTLKTRQNQAKARQREAGGPGTREVRSIISDLQGKTRIEYKQYDGLRKQVEDRYLAHLPYMKRWHQFAKQNKGMVPIAVAIFEDIRSSGRSQVSRVQAHVEGSGFTVTQILSALNAQKLILVKRGRTGGIFYPAK
ncbi:MAG: hypothetical protein KGK09_07870 [Burkholderiales bacterium]|nr:hypothetical protein [Burkholderiales bacterium]